MKTKLVVALLAGALLGFEMTFLIKFPEAKADNTDVKSVRYEFKVESFPYSSADSEKKLTELASDRWEYVGVIHGGSGSGRQSLIAFRRPKK